jgi:hypothetical protein
MRVRKAFGSDDRLLDVHAGFTVTLSSDGRASFSSEGGLDPFATARAAIRTWRAAADFLERWLQVYSDQPAEPSEREPRHA